MSNPTQPQRVQPALAPPGSYLLHHSDPTAAIIRTDGGPRQRDLPFPLVIRSSSRANYGIHDRPEVRLSDEEGRELLRFLMERYAVDALGMLA